MSDDEHDDVRRALAPLGELPDPAGGWHRLERRLGGPEARGRDRRPALALVGVAVTIGVVVAVVATSRGSSSTSSRLTGPPAPSPTPPSSVAAAESAAVSSAAAGVRSLSAQSSALATREELHPSAGVVMAPAATNRFLPDSASFLPDGSGFVVGARCAVAACRTELYRTTGGGAAYSEVVGADLDVDLTPNADEQGARGTVTLLAADAQDLLAVESRGLATEVQVSHDGGRHWSVLALPAAPEVKHASAVATASGFWIVVGDDDRAVAFRLDAASSTVVRLESCSTDARWTANHDVAYLYDKGQISRPGATGKHTLPATYGLVTVSPGGVLVMSRQTGVAAGSGPKRAWRSADGGSTWTPLPDPPFGGDLTSLTEVAPGRLVLNTTSGASTLSESSDGGRTFGAGLGFGDGGVGFSGPQLIDATHGVSVYGRPAIVTGTFMKASTIAPFGLYATDDGGSTWTSVPDADFP